MLIKSDAVKRLNKILFVIISIVFIGGLQANGARKAKFNNDWYFVKDTCDFTKAQKVHLPHDWSVLGNYDPNASTGNEGGYLPAGKGYYKKSFNISAQELGKTHRLYFEGVYMNSEVSVNGKYAGGWPYGYSSFWVDITPFLKAGDNEVMVAVDNSKQTNCRWYTGSGIYRNVWMVTTPEKYIDDWSVEVIQQGDDAVILKADIVEKGKKVSEISRIQKIENPRYWCPEDPYLYTTTMVYGEDTVPVRFGLRTIEYSTEGLKLNGKPIKLNGACVHHDNGFLGAAAFDAAEYRKVKLMKDAGFNAVRTSHNPPSETFLNACDELGLLVIDEAFDGWKVPKTPFDYSLLIDEWWDRDISSMVKRDRTHPCVFCWSIGNEVSERTKPEAVVTAAKLAECVRNNDGQKRPVTSALCSWDEGWEIFDPLAAQHDIVGYNYLMKYAESDHERVPNRVMMQTESYPRDVWENFERARSHSYIIGDFVWTGLEYLGESGIGRWYYEGDIEGDFYENPQYPWHGSYCGDVDMTGLRKPVNYYRSMLWNNEENIYIGVREPNGYIGNIKETAWGTWPTYANWNWEGWEGKPIDVEVYSISSPVAIYVNDHLIEEKHTNEGKAVFTIPYNPGKLVAVANGHIAELKTAGKPAAIRLSCDKPNLVPDNEDLAFITVEIVDENGVLVPNANQLFNIEIEGEATLQALGNADLRDIDPYYDNSHSTWNGRALAVVRAKDKAGQVKVKVFSGSLPSQEIVLAVK